MARSVPAFLWSARIIVLAVREGVMLRLYPFPRACYHPPLSESCALCFPPPQQPQHRHAHCRPRQPRPRCVPRAPTPHMGCTYVRTAEGTTLLYRLPHPRYRPARMPTHTNEANGATAPWFSWKKKKKAFLHTNQVSIMSFLGSVFNREGWSHRTPGLGVAEHPQCRLEEPNCFSQMAEHFCKECF